MTDYVRFIDCNTRSTIAIVESTRVFKVGDIIDNLDGNYPYEVEKINFTFSRGVRNTMDLYCNIYLKKNKDIK